MWIMSSIEDRNVDIVIHCGAITISIDPRINLWYRLSPFKLSCFLVKTSLAGQAMGNWCLRGCPPSPPTSPPPPTAQPAPSPPPCPSPPSTSQPAPSPRDANLQVQMEQTFGNIKDAAHLNPLIHYIDQQLSNAKERKQSGQTTKPESSRTREFLSDNVEGASKLLEHISTEAEALQKSNLASKLPEEMENVACRVLQGLGNLHWIAVGFSVIAFALERIDKVSSNFEKCLDLLQKMFALAKCLQKQYGLMPNEIDNLNKCVLAIVEGVCTCCSCMTQRKLFKYLCASTDEEKLQRIDSVIAKVDAELKLMIGMDIQEGVKDIQEQLPRRHYLSKYKAPNAVGIDERVDEVIKFLDVGGKEQPRAVILYGFGGVGKTTLADSVMARLDFGRLNLKHSRIQLDEKQPDMKRYQEQLWADLTKKRAEFGDCSQGRQELQEVLQKESTFIFIDNALKKDQIKDLLPSDLFLPADSRMLLTSRDKLVTEELLFRGIKCIEYPVKELSLDAAKKFFREIVERCKQTNPGVDSISLGRIDDVAEQCHGVPLLLRVYAQYLARHPKAYDEVLAALKQGDFSYTDESLGKKLLYVYHQLSLDKQDAFVDVCTYFHGWLEKDVSYIFSQKEINALVDGALVNIDSSNNVVLHDVLRAMGIKLGEDSRVREKKDWQRALVNKKNKETKGISLTGLASEDVFDIEYRHLSAVSESLRVLVVGRHIRFIGECRVSLPELRFLGVEDTAGEFPIFEGMDALRFAILRYDGKNAQQSQRLCETVKSMPNIQKLVFGVGTMKKFPDDFRFAESLRELDLSCSFALEELPHEFGTLRALQTLNLRRCSRLERLPDGFGTLSALQTLDLIWCDRLERLPDGFGTLSALQTLDLATCKRLERLPDGFGTLSSLQTLNLSWCERLERLPDGFGTLSALQTLNLGGCSRLERLPDGFGTLSALQTLDLRWCERLERLPDGFGTLSSLQTLDLWRCERLERLPDGFGTLSALQTLNLGGCERLERIPNGFGKLKSLQYLSMESCVNLKTLPDDFEELAMLTDLSLDDCLNLDGNTMEKLTRLKSLRELNISGSAGLIQKWEEMGRQIFDFEVTYESDNARLILS